VSIKILVVDDAIFMRSMIRDIFARGPFVTRARRRTGWRGAPLRGTPAGPHDDGFVMPQMDGITALRRSSARPGPGGDVQRSGAGGAHRRIDRSGALISS